MREQLQPILIKVEPSPLLMGILLTISIVSCVTVYIMPLDIGLKILLWLMVMGSSGYYILRDSLLLLPWSWQLLQVNSRGELTITNKRGQQFKPSLRANCFIHEHLIILNFTHVRVKNLIPPIILLNIEQDEVRKLRVWLRWFKHDKALHKAVT